MLEQFISLRSKFSKQTKIMQSGAYRTAAEIPKEEIKMPPKEKQIRFYHYYQGRAALMFGSILLTAMIISFACDVFPWISNFQKVFPAFTVVIIGSGLAIGLIMLIWSFVILSDQKNFFPKN